MTYDELMGNPVSVLAAGAAGALIRVLLAPPPTRRLLAAHLVTGTLMALFVAPAVTEYWLADAGISIRHAIAFAIGAAGPRLAEAAIRVVERRAEGVAHRLVDRVAGPDDRRDRSNGGPP